MQCLSQLKTIPNLNEEMAALLLKKGVAYDFQTSIRMLTDGNQFLKGSYDLLNTFLKKISRLQNHSVITQLLIELFHYQILDSHNQELIFSIVENLPVIENLKALKVSFFKLYLNEVSQWHIRDILCLQSHRIPLKAEFAKCLDVIAHEKRLDILKIISQLSAEKSDLKILKEFITFLQSYPQLSRLKRMISILEEKQICLSFSDFMYITKYENAEILISYISNTKIILEFHLAQLFFNSPEILENIDTEDSDALLELVSQVNHSSSQLSSFLKFSFQQGFINVQNIEMLLSCRYPEKYLSALQELMQTNIFKQSPQEVFNALIATDDPHALSKIIVLCQKNRLSLNGQFLRKIASQTQLMNIHDFLAKMFAKKISSKTQYPIELLKKLFDLDNYPEIFPYLDTILKIIHQNEFEFFILKLLKHHDIHLIMEILQNIAAPQKIIYPCSGLLKYTSWQLKQLKDFIVEYGVLNVEIIVDFSKSSFDYQYCRKELKKYIETGYISENDNPSHIQLFKILTDFEMGLFLPQIENLKLIATQEKKEFFKKIIHHKKPQELSGLFTFLGNYPIDLKAPGFKKIFNFLVNSISPFDAVQLYGQLHQNQLLRFFSISDLEYFLKQNTEASRIIAFMAHQQCILQEPQIKNIFQSLSSEKRNQILSIFNSLFRDDLLQKLLQMNVENILNQLIQHPDLNLLNQFIQTKMSINDFLDLLQCPPGFLYAFLREFKELNSDIIKLFANPSFYYPKAYGDLKKLIHAGHIDNHNQKFKIQYLLVSLDLDIHQVMQFIEASNLEAISKSFFQSLILHPQIGEIQAVINGLNYLHLEPSQSKEILTLCRTAPSPFKAFKFYRMLLELDITKAFNQDELLKYMRNSLGIDKLCAAFDKHQSVLRKHFKQAYLQDIIKIALESEEPEVLVELLIDILTKSSDTNIEILPLLRELSVYKELRLLIPIIDILSAHGQMTADNLQVILKQKSLKHSLYLLNFQEENGFLNQDCIQRFLNYPEAEFFIKHVNAYKKFHQQQNIPLDIKIIHDLFFEMEKAQHPKDLIEIFSFIYRFTGFHSNELMSLIQKIRQETDYPYLKMLFAFLSQHQELIRPLIQYLIQLKQFKNKLFLLNLLQEMNALEPELVIQLIQHRYSDPITYVLNEYKKFNRLDRHILEYFLDPSSDFGFAMYRFLRLASKIGILTEGLFLKLDSFKAILFYSPSVRQRFGYFTPDFINEINLRQLIKIAETHANNPEKASEELLRLCNLLLNNHLNPQNTHLKSVHHSASETAKRLEIRYQHMNHNVAGLYSSLIKDLEGLPASIETASAIRCVQRFKTSNDYKTKTDEASGVSLQKFLSYCILATQDQALRLSTFEDALKALAKGLFDIQRGKNHHHLEDDAPICEGGAFNKLAESLVGFHPDFEQLVITLNLASSKLQRLLFAKTKEHFQSLQMPEPLMLELIRFTRTEGISRIWPNIKDSVTQEIFEEYQSLFMTKDDPQLCSLIACAEDVDIKELDGFFQSLEEKTLVRYQQKTRAGLFFTAPTSDLQDELQDKKLGA